MLNLGIVAVITVGAVRVNNGTSEIGKIIAFMNLYTIVLNALMAINRIFMMLSRASASSARVLEVLDTPVELSRLNRTSAFCRRTRRMWSLTM